MHSTKAKNVPIDLWTNVLEITIVQNKKIIKKQNARNIYLISLNQSFVWFLIINKKNL